MSADHTCVVCKTTVRPRQEAIECDKPTCKRWTHRTCGTGISRQEYRQANKNGTSITYICDICKESSQILIESNLESQLQPLESTRVSLAASILEDETLGSSIPQEMGEFDLQFSQSENASENFDITRPERSMEIEENEDSIDNETIENGDVRDIEGQLTFEVVENGSKRGKRKLVSSDGYTFVYKRTQKNGTVVWRCSVRGQKACPVVVNECNGMYQANNSSHIHPAKPGVDVAVKIFADVKELARTDHFETAGTTLKQVTDRYMDHQLPEASRPVESTLGRICRRARSAARPKDPTDLSFQLNTEYIASTTNESFLRDDIKVDDQRHLIFTTDEQLQLLANAKTWYLDGTFKIIKRPFIQLLSIHAFVRSGEDMKQLPLCFIIMSRRQKKDYKKVLRSVLNLLPSEMKVESFVVDFESGMWGALRSIFDDPVIHGCAFHFGQALWRNVQQKGLQPVYTKKDRVYKLLRQKETPADQQLHLAALQGNLEQLKKVLDSGKVHVDCKDKEGTTPLILASANNHIECARELLNQGADPKARRLTGTCSLFFAAQGGFLDIVKLLLENGAPVDLASYDGGTPLFVACQCNQADIATELLDHGADIHAQMIDGATPFFIASQNGHTKLIKYLISKGADVNMRRKDQASPLWIAAQMGHAELCSVLLEAGAEKDAPREDGATALFKACHKGHLNVVEEILKHKPNMGILKNGETALHAAALFGHLKILKVLVAHGDIDLSLKNKEGQTAAQLAREAGYEYIAKYLDGIHAEKLSSLQNGNESSNNNLQQNSNDAMRLT